MINKIINFFKRLYFGSTFYIDNTLKTSTKTNEIEKKYSQYIDLHYTILEKLTSMYSNAINSNNIFNDYSEECIKLCYKDLEIAPFIIQWQQELAIAHNVEYIPLNYRSHKYLINILKKQNRIEEAITVCDKYIELGLIKDGTKGGISKRKENLLKLLKK